MSDGDPADLALDHDEPLARLRDVEKSPFVEEYERLAATFGWTAREFLARNLDMVEAAFTDEATKQRLREELTRGWR